MMRDIFSQIISQSETRPEECPSSIHINLCESNVVADCHEPLTQNIDVEQNIHEIVYINNGNRERTEIKIRIQLKILSLRY